MVVKIGGETGILNSKSIESRWGYQILYCSKKGVK